MTLPITHKKQVSELCNDYSITQMELVEEIGVYVSKLSRIVSGETKTVGSDILMCVANMLKTSMNYILGLSTVSVHKSYYISEQGLFEELVKKFATGAVDVDIFNRLLGEKNLQRLISLIQIYYQVTVASSIMVRN